MSIEWIDMDNTAGLEDEDYEDEELEEEEEEQLASNDDGGGNMDSMSPYLNDFVIKTEPCEGGGEMEPMFGYETVQCPECRKSFPPAAYDEHRLQPCQGKRARLEKHAKCEFCQKALLAVNMARHYSTCRALVQGGTSTSAKPRFSARKVIDIMEVDELGRSTTRVHGQMAADSEDGENEQAVVCPECLKCFSDQQGRDEHLVYNHHYHFRIKFAERDSFKKWFQGMRFDQIMYKANMSTVNGVTYEYYFCLYTAVSRRVRIRDRCPCRAFVKENSEGLTVSYLDVHSHPQLKYKRYMTEECRAVILSMLEYGKKNKAILDELRTRYGESSINFTIARTTINSIRFQYKKKVWAGRHGSIEELRRTLNEEVARQRAQPQFDADAFAFAAAVSPQQLGGGRAARAPAPVDQGTQTEPAGLELAAEESAMDAPTREDRDAVFANLVETVLPELEAALCRPSLSARQLHQARLYISKLVRDLNPDRRDTDHDYTYLTAGQ